MRSGGRVRVPGLEVRRPVHGALIAARVRVRGNSSILLRAGPRGVASRRELPKGRGVVLPLLRRRGVFDGGCIGAQRTVLSMVLGVLGNGLRIPLAALFASKYGVDGVWWAITLSTI